jgi:selenocysteine lyase/cysteine desulfurase
MPLVGQVQTSAPDWAALRREFPLLDRRVYLNACSLGPLPRAGYEALRAYADAWDRLGTPAWYSDFLPLLERLRSAVATLLGAPAGSVAVVPHASAALSTLASCLPRATPKVVIARDDFPTDGHQWLSRPDVSVDFVDGPALASSLDGAGLVCTTHVVFGTGEVRQVEAICSAASAAGATSLIDGYHACGSVPIDVAAISCDAYVGGCLKWLSGGPGTAFLYVRPELIPTLRPVGTGWFATAEPFSFTTDRLDFAPDARRFESGTWPMPSHFAALAGLELVLSVGVEAICARLRALTGRIISQCVDAGLEVLTPLEPERRSGMVTVRCTRGDEVEHRLLERNVVIDSRPGRIRISPHWSQSEAEVDAGTAMVLEELRRSSS